MELPNASLHVPGTLDRCTWGCKGTCGKILHLASLAIEGRANVGDAIRNVFPSHLMVVCPQDESGILEICFKILDANPNFRANAHEDCLSRKDPVYVSRMLSAMVGLALPLRLVDSSFSPLLGTGGVGLYILFCFCLATQPPHPPTSGRGGYTSTVFSTKTFIF